MDIDFEKELENYANGLPPYTDFYTKCEVKKAYRAGFDLLKEQYEDLKDKYEALHMTYLSQVSLYKSLYKEEKEKNKNGV